MNMNHEIKKSAIEKDHVESYCLEYRYFHFLECLKYLIHIYIYVCISYIYILYIYIFNTNTSYIIHTYTRTLHKSNKMKKALK